MIGSRREAASTLSHNVHGENDVSQRGKRAVSLIDSGIDKFILVLVLFMLAVSAYAIWDSTNVYRQADASNYQAFKPDRAEHLPSFADLQTMNPDVFGWVSVYGTKIDYPMVQGADDLKYLSTDPMGNYSYSGSIFLDSRAQKDFSDFASFVYGHHMEGDVMFGSLDHFNDPDFFNSHEYGDIYYGDKHHGLQIFAVINVDNVHLSPLYYSPVRAGDAQRYLSLIYQNADHVRDDVDISPDDHIVMLSTCHSTSSDGRMALAAKITDQTYDDPFAADVNTGTGLQNPLTGLWAFLMGHRWIAPLALLGLIALYKVLSNKQGRSQAPSGVGLHANHALR